MNLVIERVQKAYDGKPVLQNCTFAFPEGRVTVLMGPNGCGKSTLLRICALLEQPDSGSVVVSDKGVPLAPDLFLRRRMTLVLPRVGVFNTTVCENVAYGLRLRGYAHPNLKRKVAEALAFVGMGHKADQNARTLSSGETQRMGIARALAVDPDVLFLDEPTASVDEENTEIIETVIRDMRKAGTTTTIMTTHDRDQAERLADTLLVLGNGVLAGQAPAR